MKTSIKQLPHSPSSTLIARYVAETSSHSTYTHRRKSLFQYAGWMFNSFDKFVHPRSSR